MTRPHCLAADACVAKGSGHCRRCWGNHLKALSLADPAIEAKRRASVSRVMTEHNIALRSTPEGRARLAETARRHAVLLRPENQAKTRSPEAIAKRKVSRAATLAAHPERRFIPPPASVRLKWCPDDRLDEYRKAARYYGAKAARQMIEEDERTQARRAVQRSLDEQRARQARERAEAY